MCLATDAAGAAAGRTAGRHGRRGNRTHARAAGRAEVFGHAILLVEHDMDAVFRIADRITVMVNGAVIASGTPDAVRANANVQAPTWGATEMTQPTELDRRRPRRARLVRQQPCAARRGHRIGRGETVGLLGRNGMGKSTLIRTLLGHVAQRDGRIRVFGRRLSRAPAARGGAPRRGLRARRARRVRQPERAREPGDGRARAAAPQRRLDLRARAGRPSRAWPNALHHLGGQLSGGEQQMLSIGRALMTSPELIVLDEATEGLAPLIVARHLARHRRDPRQRHRHAHRRPRLPQGAGAAATARWCCRRARPCWPARHARAAGRRSAAARRPLRRVPLRRARCRTASYDTRRRASKLDREHAAWPTAARAGARDRRHRGGRARPRRARA
jgi:ABC-type branched-subunit amino acid transport system ATPase component